MASESEYQYPISEKAAGNNLMPKSLPPEKVFIIGIGIFLVVAAFIYGIAKATTPTSDFHEFDLNSQQSSSKNEKVAGTSIVGPYGKPTHLPSPTSEPTTSPTAVPVVDTPTPTPTNQPGSTSTPTPTPTVTPTVTPTSTASPSGTITPTGTE